MRPWLLFLLAAAIAGTPLYAAAQQQAGKAMHPGLERRFDINIGGYFPRIDTKLRVDSPTLGVGTTVDFESDLGLTDHQSRPWVLASFRFWERWRIEGEYFNLSRSRTVPINRTIQFRDTVYPINTVLQAEYDVDVYRLGVGYSFLKDA